MLAFITLALIEIKLGNQNVTKRMINPEALSKQFFKIKI